jgi:hypothetical protein
MRNFENPLNSQFEDAVVPPKEFKPSVFSFPFRLRLSFCWFFPSFSCSPFHFDGSHIFIESNVLSIRIMLEGVADLLRRHARASTTKNY